MGRAAPDFRIDDNGTLWTFKPLSVAAEAHCDEHMPDDCPMWGSAYAVEHRYAPPIAARLLNLGFVLELDGVTVGAKSS